MKHKYIFLIVLLVGFLSFSQTCPEISFVVPLPTEEVVFIYDNPGPDCVDRPAAIVIDGSAYSLGNCDTYSSRYVLASGSGVIDPNNFSVTYGSLTCGYNNGTLLGLEDAQGIIGKAIKIFPNPIQENNELEINFSVPLKVTLSIYDITGKEVIATKLDYEDKSYINISGLKTGLYLARFTTETVTITKKFIINR